MTAIRVAPVLAENRSNAAPQNDGHLLTSRTGDGIAILTLNRPQDYNALSVGLVKSLIDALEEIGEDDSVRVVVLQGSGSSFSSGIDHGELRTGSPDDGRAGFYRAFSCLLELFTQIPQPVIAKVRGLAASEGCQVVAGCDLAVASRSARFALPDVKAGLVCAFPQVTLARAIGNKRALEMALTSAVITGDQAGMMGLVNSVVADHELDDAVQDLALRIASMPKKAVTGSKQAFYRQIDLPPTEAYKTAAEAATRDVGSRDTERGRNVFQARRLGA